MSEVKATARKASIYVFGMMLSQAAGFIMLPIYTRYLTPTMYGKIQILTLSIDVIGLLVGLGIQQSFSRLYYDYKDDKSRKEFLTTAYVIVFMTHALSCVVGLLFSQQLGGVLLNGTPEDTSAFRLIFFIMLLGALYDVPLLFIQVQQKAALYVSITFASLVLQLSLNILFVVFLGKGVVGVLTSTMIAKGVIGIGLAGYYYRFSGFEFSSSKAKSICVYASPLVLLSIGDFVITFADRYFLKAFSGLAVVGIYSLGYKLAFLMMEVGFNSIQKSWGPKRFQLADTKDFKQTHSSVFVFITTSVVTISLLLTVASRDFFRVIAAEAYWDAYQVVPYVMCAYLFQAWALFSNFGLFKVGRTRLLGYIGAFAALVFVASCYLLIPKYGMFGAAWATIIAMLVRFLCIYTFSQKYLPLPFQWNKVFMIVGSAVVWFSLSAVVRFDGIVASIAYNSMLFFGHLVSVWVLPVLSPYQKKTVVEALCAKVKACTNFIRA